MPTYNVDAWNEVMIQVKKLSQQTGVEPSAALFNTNNGHVVRVKYLAQFMADVSKALAAPPATTPTVSEAKAADDDGKPAIKKKASK